MEDGFDEAMEAMGSSDREWRRRGEGMVKAIVDEGICV